jgi:hypothetical protein
VLALRPLLRGVPRGVDALFPGAPRAELAVVMVAMPLCMNLAQAWLQDAWLKARPRAPRGGADETGGGVELLQKRKGGGELEAAPSGVSGDDGGGGGGGGGGGEEEAEEAALLPRGGRDRVS